MKCVLCDNEAITTAAQIPVCQKHFEKYQDEGRQYLPVRPFYKSLVAAQQSVQSDEVSCSQFYHSSLVALGEKKCPRCTEPLCR